MFKTHHEALDRSPRLRQLCWNMLCSVFVMRRLRAYSSRLCAAVTNCCSFKRKERRNYTLQNVTFPFISKQYLDFFHDGIRRRS
jgi:hypothetical protein